MGRVMGRSIAAVYYTAGTMARRRRASVPRRARWPSTCTRWVKEGLYSGEAFATATIPIVITVGLNALASFIAKRLSRRLTGV